MPQDSIHEFPRQVANVLPVSFYAARHSDAPPMRDSEERDTAAHGGSSSLCRAGFL